MSATKSEATIEALARNLETARREFFGAARRGAPMHELRSARDRLVDSERALAHARGQEVAEALEWEAPWDLGAPRPCVFVSGRELFLGYKVDLRWANVHRGLVENGEWVAVVRFSGVLAHRFGPPNDEALAGHPLYGKGLSAYGAHSIARSSWIGELERRNRVHPHHKTENFAGLRHYLLCFHDETFECVAESHAVKVLDGMLPPVLFYLATSWPPSRDDR